MKRLGLIIGAVVALIIGVLLGVGPVWLTLFAGVGLLAGVMAGRMPKRAERLYWAALFVQIGLLVAAFMGAGIPGPLMIIPMVFILTYFVCRITGHTAKT